MAGVTVIVGIAIARELSLVGDTITVGVVVTMLRMSLTKSIYVLFYTIPLLISSTPFINATGLWF